MGLKLADLLRYKKEVKLTNQGEPILDDKGEPVVAYVRIIGDHDLQEAYKAARVASAKARKALRDKRTIDYREKIEVWDDSTKEECIQIIKAARHNDYLGEAMMAIERPELPTIEEFAKDPDVPSLEEQEKLDAAIEEVDREYKAKMEEYIQTKSTELDSILAKKKLEELRNEAKEFAADVRAMEVFMEELNEQKVYRSVFTDRVCREPAFEDIDEYKNTARPIKLQLMEAYKDLEANPEDIKN